MVRQSDSVKVRTCLVGEGGSWEHARGWSMEMRREDGGESRLETLSTPGVRYSFWGCGRQCSGDEGTVWESWDTVGS